MCTYLRAIGVAVERGPGKPHATDDYNKFGCAPYPRRLALEKPHVQLNRSNTCSVLVFDVDHEFNFNNGQPHLGACWAWERHNLPPPSWVAINRENGHAHLAYVLDEPVLRLYDKTCKPVWLLSVIKRAMTAALGADPGYPNFLTKNPLHENWLVLEFGKTYSLNELCDWIPDIFLEAAKANTTISVSPEEEASYSSFPWAFEKTRHILYANWRKVVSEATVNGLSPTLEHYCREELTEPNTGELLLSEESFQKLLRDLTKWGLEHFNENVSRNLLHQRQSRRGKRSAHIRREHTAQLVKNAVTELQYGGKRVTTRAVAGLIGKNHSLISKCYKHLLP